MSCAFGQPGQARCKGTTRVTSGLERHMNCSPFHCHCLRQTLAPLPPESLTAEQTCRASRTNSPSPSRLLVQESPLLLQCFVSRSTCHSALELAVVARWQQDIDREATSNMRRSLPAGFSTVSASDSLFVGLVLCAVAQGPSTRRERMRQLHSRTPVVRIDVNFGATES